MEHLILPEMLNIPDKLLPLIERFNDYRYFIIKGGRGGGKSQSVGRFVLYLNTKYRLRTVCGRETQNSIRESVHSLLSDLIREKQLNFEIKASEIVHRATESPINFRGFREQGAFNIQGMEGIDLLWIDESQALTKQTLDVLIPTIRKENAKIVFTMNPHVFNDPVIVMLSHRPDCLVIEINYDENPFCTVALKNEAEECRKLSQKDYEHIWMGKPLDQSDDAVFSMDDILNGQKNAHHLSPGYGFRIAAYDIARFGDDKCADVILQQMGALHWEEYHVDEWGERDLNYTTGRILQISTEHEVGAAVVDEDGLGAGPLDTLRMGRNLDYFHGFRNLPYSFQDNKYFGNVRTANAFKVKKMLTDGHLCLRNKKLIDELLTAFKYTFDHYQRRILISKDLMKSKYNIPSPNSGDSVIMAVSRIGEIKYQQDRQYESNQQQTAKEEDLFKIAGIQ